MSNKSLLTAGGMCILLIIGVIFYPKQNVHKPFSNEEIMNIINPPLTGCKTKNDSLYKKYFYAPTFKKIEIKLLPAMLEVMSFEKYGDMDAFVFTHPHDSLASKNERPIYVVDKKDKVLFKQAIIKGEILLFTQTGKQIWTFYVSR